jgi:hypothetical protein
MKSKIQIVRLLSLLVLFLFLLGSCRDLCLEIPETDSSYPTAGMFLEYFIDGNSLTKTLTADDAITTITAEKNRPVTILYSGQDDEGMKSVHIDVSVTRTMGGVQQRVDYNIAPIVSSCPKKVLMGTFTLEKDQGERSARISVQSTNWLGMQTSTQHHIIIIE